MAAEMAIISAGLSIGSTVIGSFIQMAELQEEEDQQLETYEDELRYTQETGSDQLKELSASSAYDMRTAAAEGQQVVSASKNIAGESGTRNTGTTAATQKQTEVQVSEELARLKAQSDYTQKAAAAEYTFMNEQLEQKIAWMDTGTPTTPNGERVPGGAAGTGGTIVEEEEVPVVGENEKTEKANVDKEGKTGGASGPGAPLGDSEYSNDKTTESKQKGVEKINTKTADKIKTKTTEKDGTVNVTERGDEKAGTKNDKTTEKVTKEKYAKEKVEKAEKSRERAERQKEARESRF